MKKGKFLLTVGFLAVSSWVLGQGQDYAFRVLANKGSNEVKSGDAWQAIKTGSSLKPGDELKVSENSYLGLVHKSGKPIEIKQAGSYKVSDLAAKVGGGTSVLNQYVDFVLSSNSAEAKKNRMSATGAVHRGLESIKVLLPANENSSVYNNSVVINWESEEPGPYIVTLKNMFEDELLKAETPEKSLEVNLADPKFASESAILVEVKSKSDAKSKSEQKLIKKLSPDDQKKIKKSLDADFGEVKEESALNDFLMASFYEKNQLYIDAISSYEKAIKMAPDVPTYKEDYEEFLFRNKIKTPSAK